MSADPSLDPERVWQRVQAGLPTAVFGRLPDPPPELHLLRVSCDVAPAELRPLIEARRRAEAILDEAQPLIDQARERVVSGLRRRLLGEAPERTTEAVLVEVWNNLAKQTGRAWALVLEAVEAADAATLAALGQIVRRPGWLQLPLVLVFRGEPSGAAAELLATLRAHAGPEAIVRGEAVREAEASVRVDWRALPPAALRVLRAGALVGPGFEAEVVAALLELGPIEVIERLQEAADHGVPLEDRGDGRFSLPAPALASLTATILPSLAQAWHRRLGQLLSARAAEADEAVLAGMSGETGERRGGEVAAARAGGERGGEVAAARASEERAGEVAGARAGGERGGEVAAARAREERAREVAAAERASEDRAGEASGGERASEASRTGERRREDGAAAVGAEPVRVGDERAARPGVRVDGGGAEARRVPVGDGSSSVDAGEEGPGASAGAGAGASDGERDMSEGTLDPGRYAPEEVFASAPVEPAAVDAAARAAAEELAAERAAELAAERLARGDLSELAGLAGHDPRVSQADTILAPVGRAGGPAEPGGIGRTGTIGQDPRGSRGEAHGEAPGDAGRGQVRADVHGDPLIDAARAAEHLRMAGEIDAAAERFCAAARSAAEAGAPQAAAQYARRALALLSRLPTSPGRRRQRVRALIELGRVQWQSVGPELGSTLSDALTTLEAARQEVGQGDPVALYAELCQAIAGVCFDLGDLRSLERALEELGTASRALHAAGDATAAARLLNDQAAVYVRMGDPVRALHLLRESRRVFEASSKADPVVLRELAETDLLFARIPLHAQLRPGREQDGYTMGLDHAIAAERAYRQLGDRRELGRVWETMGRLELAKGRLERATQRLQAALEVQMQIGDLTGLARTTEALSEVLAAGGRDAEALTLLRDSVLFNREKGSPLGLAFNRRTFQALARRVAARVELAPALSELADLLDAGEGELGTLRLPGEGD